MGNTELEKRMMNKFRLSDIEAEELGQKMNQYVETFEDKYLYQSLCDYLETELKNTYQKYDVGDKNIKKISRAYIQKEFEWNNTQGYDSFVGYILTVIGQVACFLPDAVERYIVFAVSVIVVYISNKIAMKMVRKYSAFIKEFNNNFPSLIILSIIVCLGINAINGKAIGSIIAVLTVNIGLVVLYIVTKRGRVKRKNCN